MSYEQVSSAARDAPEDQILAQARRALAAAVTLPLAERVAALEAVHLLLAERLTDAHGT